MSISRLFAAALAILLLATAWHGDAQATVAPLALRTEVPPCQGTMCFWEPSRFPPTCNLFFFFEESVVALSPMVVGSDALPSAEQLRQLADPACTMVGGEKLAAFFPHHKMPC